MEVRGVLVHPELLQPAVTHVLVQDLHLLHPGHARQVLLRGEGGSVLELQTKARKDFIITEEALTPPLTDRNCVSNKDFCKNYIFNNNWPLFHKSTLFAGKRRRQRRR